MSTREKGADEIFCRSCGEPIKRAAEICPNCGVKNEKSTSGGGGGARTTASSHHDPSQYDTTVSENWYYLIGASVVLWILYLITSDAAGSGVLETLSALFLLVAWIGMPVGIYFDKLYLRANSEWNPNTWLWVIFAVIPLINIIAGGIYLYRRHEVLGVP